MKVRAAQTFGMLSVAVLVSACTISPPTSGAGGTATSDEDLAGGPSIDAPATSACPYHEEVSELSDTTEQIALARELGCEPGIHGEIRFDEPIGYIESDAAGQEDPLPVFGLISTTEGLSTREMHEEGYISEEDYERELNRWQEIEH